MVPTAEAHDVSGQGIWEDKRHNAVSHRVRQGMTPVAVGYDLVINTDVLTAAQAATVVLAGVQPPSLMNVVRVSSEPGIGKSCLHSSFDNRRPMGVSPSRGWGEVRARWEAWKSMQPGERLMRDSTCRAQKPTMDSGLMQRF